MMAMAEMLRESGPLEVFGSALRHRQLIWRLAVREFEAQFRGSLLGRVWAALGPLSLLALYTYVFGVVMQAHWPGTATGDTLQVALLYFAGMVFFNFYLECINRAPSLLLENVAYIKKVVFPLDILAWVALIAALLRFSFGVLILLVFYFALEGIPPIAALAVLLMTAPLALVALGFVWFLSALGVYLRDVRQAMTVIAPAIMFMSPVFYPMSVVPEPFHSILYINPLTFAIESVRGALFDGQWPNWMEFSIYSVLAWLFAWLGRSWFMSVRGGFADVV
jgi:lipopolysaccharide transport system permease protein